MFKKLFKKNKNIIKNVISSETYIEKMKYDFIEDEGFRYPDNNSKGSEYEYITSITSSYLSKEINYQSPELIMTRLRSWHLDNCFYQIMHKKNSNKALEYFAQSALYGFISLYTNRMAANCQFPYKINDYSYPLANTYLAQCLIAGYDKEYESIIHWFYTSIQYREIDIVSYVNEHDTIYLDTDTDRYTSVWFLYYLNHKAKKITINIDTPPLDEYYKQIVDNWDTEDMRELEKFIYNLSEYHLEKTREDTKEEQLNNEFNNPLYWLFPYEILAWLKLREQAGHKNPKTFTHPLMNTPIAKMFLDIKEPLPKPTELPYAKELLEKLKGQCPEVEIPT